MSSVSSMSSKESLATLADPAYRRALGGGLLVRWSTENDANGLAQLCAEVFRDEEGDPPNIWFGNWIHDLISGRHPLVGAGDFALVEDTHTGEIVAGAVLMRQTWEYGGIAFPIGRPEAVATKVAYRNRGLIRAIFDVMHARCDTRGDLAIGITGIYYYYRQFGYEYALDLGGRRSIPLDAIPTLPAGAIEPYTLRAATVDDLPRVMALYNRDRKRAVVSTVIDEPTWRWIVSGMHPENDVNWLTQLILDQSQRAIGYVLTSRTRYGNRFGIRGLGVEDGIPLTGVMPSVLRALAAQAPSVPAPYPRTQPTSVIGLGLGRAHPAYDALPPAHLMGDSRPYAWYVRVADLPRFIRHIAPVLEQRLPGTAVEGYTGEARLSFYRGGLRLVFESGRLVTAEDWAPGAWDAGNAGFPPLVFLKLVFGYQNLEELQAAYPDVWVSDSTRPLLEALFPSWLSWVLPVD